MDILSTAIGKPDHPGRVRGESKTVGLTQYFGRASRTVQQSRLSPEYLSQLESQIEAKLEIKVVAKVEAKVRAEMMALFDDRMESLTRASMQAWQSHEVQYTMVYS